MHCPLARGLLWLIKMQLVPRTPSTSGSHSGPRNGRSVKLVFCGDWTISNSGSGSLREDLLPLCREYLKDPGLRESLPTQVLEPGSEAQGCIGFGFPVPQLLSR